jgi:hypothetical protein
MEMSFFRRAAIVSSSHRFVICNSSRYYNKKLTTTSSFDQKPASMATRYAKDQPEGFTNRIERVAIIGVSQKKIKIKNHLNVERKIMY